MQIEPKTKSLFPGSCGVEQAPPKERGQGAVVLRNLYQQHASHIVAYLQRHYGFGPPEPEDVVQEVFTKYGEYQQKNFVDNPKAYLYKMAINVMLNGLKRLKRVNTLLEGELAEIDEAMPDNTDPESIAQRAQELSSLDHAVSQLTEKQREILIRSRLKGETYAQIAKELGYSQADICRQLYLAISVLQQYQK